ncbi:MAG: ATP-binding cassette domain-containing protein, partial [Acidobacteria bacterium]|nr:ATP-binding cassette domain-containing protein [Acidobacteriota bacterium]
EDTFLFSDSIAANIAFADPDASMERIEHAAHLAGAHGFISELPQGYDTEIGERGFSLSGGQRQRIAIARAVLKNSPVIILDEATSALDTESEKLVQKALANLMKDHTSIVIAHRLSTVVKADLIVVMEKGRIIESGTHAELLEKSGKYKLLYELQFGTNQNK